MRPNQQKTADLIIFAEEIFNEKISFLMQCEKILSQKICVTSFLKRRKVMVGQ